MQRAKYAPEFKDEAVKQVIDKGNSVVDVAKRLVIAEGVLYTWVSKFKKADEAQSSDLKALQAEMAKLKAELRRTTEERHILKKAAKSELKPSQKSSITSRVSTIVFDAISISINSVPMSSSGSIRLRFEICLEACIDLPLSAESEALRKRWHFPTLRT
jgi:transposase